MKKLKFQLGFISSGWINNNQMDFILFFLPLSSSLIFEFHQSFCLCQVIYRILTLNHISDLVRACSTRTQQNTHIIANINIETSSTLSCLLLLLHILSSHRLLLLPLPRLLFIVSDQSGDNLKTAGTPKTAGQRFVRTQKR